MARKRPFPTSAMLRSRKSTLAARHRTRKRKSLNPAGMPRLSRGTFRRATTRQSSGNVCVTRAFACHGYARKYQGPHRAQPRNEKYVERSSPPQSNARSSGLNRARLKGENQREN